MQHKLEAQYAMKLESALGDVNNLRQQLELKANEVKSSSAAVDELRSANAELEVRQCCFTIEKDQSLISDGDCTARFQDHRCWNRGRKESR